MATGRSGFMLCGPDVGSRLCVAETGCGFMGGGSSSHVHIMSKNFCSNSWILPHTYRILCDFNVCIN